MSYDVRVCVQTVAENKFGDPYAVVYIPKYDSPTYNLRPIFTTCMNWDYVQGEYYPLKAVLPKFRHGLAELIEFPEKYKPLEPDNGWGTVESAKKCLSSWLHELEENYYDSPTYEWDIENLWWRW